MTDKSAQALADQIRQLPRDPGVYRFYDADDTLLYVGKANALHTRVRTYFSATALAPRTRMMVKAVVRIEVTIVPSAGDALLLEQEQIQTLKPRFNVLFRDDKTYPYLRLTNHAAPRLQYFRGKPDRDCFGPYPNAFTVRETIRILQRVFRLRTCTDANYANRSRPCMLYEINRCSAPCVGHTSLDDYAADVANARAFLAGHDDSVAEKLVAAMEQAAECKEFEKAAQYRDSIKALADVRRVSSVTGGAADADFIGIHHDANGTAVHLAAVRSSRLIGELSFIPANAQLSTREDIAAAFVTQHYARHPPPPRVVLQSTLPGAQLERLIGNAKVTVLTRPQGNERRRVEMAAVNATATLTKVRSGSEATAAALAQLSELVGRPVLERIDCFDVSHSFGEEAVASCVVCAHGEMDKKQYRHYRLRHTPRGDDYAALRETLRRRYRNAATDAAVLPDLVVMDGGAGQVGVAVEVLAEYAADQMRVLGIAKGPRRRPGEETLLTDAGEILTLPPTTPAFRLLQRMRDEAHRFALTGHRRRRAKQRGSVLEKVEGIGPARRRMLVNVFGGLQGLRRASVQDLSRIKGVGTELARRIYLTLHT